MSEQRCKYCGCKNAIYYNELIDTHYCPDCSQKAREEWLDLMGQILAYSASQEDEADE